MVQQEADKRWTTKKCHSRKKEECPLEGKCRSENVVHVCVTTVTGHTRRTYLGTSDGSFKRYYNHKMSFTNKSHANNTSLSKYVWEIKEK